jgi:uncharacterized protein with ATP-grasp and redox domains
MSRTVVFSALLNREDYTPGLWDLTADLEARSYWIPALKRNSRHMLDSFMESAPSQMREPCDRAHERFRRLLDDFERDLDPLGPRTVNEIVRLRQEIFTECGIPDPYRDLKRADNERALAVLRKSRGAVPTSVPESERLRWLVSLALAGNLLDMGSAEARRLHKDAGVTVLERTAEVESRTWFRDALGELDAALRSGPRGNGVAVICIDNAGAEIVLGVTALVKHIASLGYSCTIAANEVPALNDMTAVETRPLLDSIAAAEPEIGSLLDSDRLRVISSGSVTSGLNMLEVSVEFDRIASRCELLLVLGQGRAVETNWNTALSIPWARVATVKDTFVARAVGCRVFDPLVTFQNPS